METLVVLIHPHLMYVPLKQKDLRPCWSAKICVGSIVWGLWMEYARNT